MDYAVARRKMVSEQLQGRGIKDQRILRAMEIVPRHAFVPEALVTQAYQDHPLNIGYRQTISQPYIVGVMTEALRLSEGEKVLEIGTGCGYQTAVLCELRAKVFSIERIPELSNRARKTLYSIGYDNFHLRIGDGSQGWPEEAPFDAILITAASPQWPQPLMDQLGEGGRMVIPVGSADFQELYLGIKQKGKIIKKKLTDCRFVKLLGEHGWREIN